MHPRIHTITFETDIMFVVRVPVLSLQITVVQPKVSTDGNDRTIAFSRAILLVPRAKQLDNKSKEHCKVQQKNKQLSEITST